MLRRLIIVLTLLTALGLWDVWLNEHNPFDRFRPSFYGRWTPAFIVVPLGATAIVCVVVAILTTPSTLVLSPVSILRRLSVIILAVGTVESAVLGGVSLGLRRRAIELVPCAYFHQPCTEASALYFVNGRLAGRLSFAADYETVRRLYLAEFEIAGLEFRLMEWAKLHGMDAIRFPGRICTLVFFAVPFWLLASVLSAHPAIAFLRGPLRQRRRRRRGLCVRCGYNLTGNVSGLCPECGTEIKSP